MLKKHKHIGEVALEYIIIGAIAVTVMGVALYGIAQAVAAKLAVINADIGS